MKPSLPLSRVGVLELAPALTLVVGTVEAALLAVFDGGVESPRVLAVDGKADASQLAVGQPLAELLPGAAAVDGLPRTAARSTAVVAELSSAPLIGRRVQRVRAQWVHGQIDEAGVLVDELGVDPGLAAVRLLDDPPLR